MLPFALRPRAFAAVDSNSSRIWTPHVPAQSAVVKGSREKP